jgi:hypothetical protein
MGPIQYDKVVGGISAVVSMVGTALIWIDAQHVNGKTSEILLELTQKVGIWVAKPWTEEQQNELRNMVKNSGKINIRGFLFLILGFFLQLVSFFL